MTSFDLCCESLDGLSVGDAVGAQFFVPGTTVTHITEATEPPGAWPWTDDTEMACSIVDELAGHGRIDRDRLAAAFVRRYEPYRGYGGGAVVILHQIRDGVPWREAARSAFDGLGSMGNGAAMRVAPLGAFHAGDSRSAALDAMRTAEVTHAHSEGILGAVAVAVAAAEAAWSRLVEAPLEPVELFDAVLAYQVDSQVKTGLRRARDLLGASVAEAAYTLGNGSQVLAQDTVPFALWVAATHLSDYRSAILACVEAGGDVDTTAAIVGGVVAAAAGRAAIPDAWLTHREPLPSWVRTADS
ncbi:ADP-ribosylglycohydrolase family protein [Dactylosporangium aurantiacum]|uniref:ADP-ribosylglycohydrolase family protein n=1 Tax=Dactylosporangium aurantiacum TaxID=35754 RepID=A0A9Q9IJ94_9ACTN|nr:ADP-ribosylglycohydrolase family protein [Dactylosporangium aurantiacum]MDG6109805.1 ADP-ribosylglycohydrolase family protein [Dactylosporangium aurantiacum]UWZ57164.1 ADP-ribosylglycohydrolase family protein [Dactylosporangium aurantiacum]